MQSETNKQYVKDQSEEWKIQYSLPVAGKLMRVDYNGGKDYKLHASFQKVMKPLQEEFNSNYLGVNYDEELQLLISHASRTINNADSMQITLNKNNFKDHPVSYTNFVKLLGLLQDHGYGSTYIGNQEYTVTVEGVKSKGFSKKAGKVFKTVKSNRSLFVFHEKFQQLFLGIPKKHYKPEKKVSPKDFVQQMITVDKVNDKGEVVLNSYGNAEKTKKRKEGKLLKSAPFKSEMKIINTHLVDRVKTEHDHTLEVWYKRVFGDNWQANGRLYSKYSILSKSVRRSLIIDNEKVVECDFDSMHPRLLCEREGIFLPDNFEAYTTENREDILFQYDEEHHRAIYKVALIACLSAKTKRGLTSSVRNGLKKAGFNLEDGLAKRIVNDLKSHNSDIADYFGSDMSAELQNIDSTVAVKVMMGLVKHDVGFLAYHDSFLVPKSKEGLLMDLMSDAWEEVLSSKFNCIITSTSGMDTTITASTNTEYTQQDSYTDYHHNDDLDIDDLPF